MKKPLKDRKNKLMIGIFAPLNRFFVDQHFESVEVIGRDNLPETGPFLLVANHTTRWDAPVVQYMLNRPANYMTSPNELRGLQGMLLPTVGAFPANPRRDIISFARDQAERGQPLVVFPEGDIKRDGATHPFKSGAAKIALICSQNGTKLPVVPVAIRYYRPNRSEATGDQTTQRERVQIMIAPPIDPCEYLTNTDQDALFTQRALTTRMHREICHLRVALGERGDRETVFTGRPVRTWMPRILPGTRELSV